MNAKVSNAQAGAVAWCWLWADGSRASEWFDGFPTEAAVRNGAEKGAHVEYLSPPAAVPVEALEGLVAEWRDQAKRLRNEVPNLRDGSDKRFAAACDADQAADELTQLIKERSNG